MKKRVMSFLVVLVISGLSVFSLASANGNAAVNINYWFSWGGFWGNQHQEILSAFNKTHPEIKVTGLTIPYNEMIPKLLTAIAAGDPPEMVTIFGGTNAGLYPKMFACLDDFVKENEETMGPQNWFPEVLEYVKFEGKLYGLVWVSSSEGLFYNVDLFREAGLDPQNPPKYWRDLEVASEKLTKKNEQGQITTLGFWFPGDVRAFDTNWTIYWFYRNNGRLWDPEKKEMTLTDPKNIETLEYLASWARKNGPEEIERFIVSAEAVSPEVEGWFEQGKLVMAEFGPWSVGHITEHAPNLNYDVGMVPYPESGKPVTTNYVDAMYIPRGNKHLQEAWTFISWMATEGTTMWSTKFGETPARYDVAASPDFEKMSGYDLFKRISVDYHKYGKASLPGFPIRTIFGDQATRYYQQVMHLKMSPKDALEELQVVMQEELDKFYEKR